MLIWKPKFDDADMKYELKHEECFFFQIDAQQSSATVRLFKLSLTLMTAGAAIYYVHVRNPTTIPTLLSKLHLQKV